MHEGTVRHKGRVLGGWVDNEGFPRVSVKVNAKANPIPGASFLPFALDAFLPDVAGASPQPRTS